VRKSPCVQAKIEAIELVEVFLALLVLAVVMPGSHGNRERPFRLPPTLAIRASAAPRSIRAEGEARYPCANGLSGPARRPS